MLNFEAPLDAVQLFIERQCEINGIEGSQMNVLLVNKHYCNFTCFLVLTFHSKENIKKLAAELRVSAEKREAKVMKEAWLSDVKQVCSHYCYLEVCLILLSNSDGKRNKSCVTVDYRNVSIK
jgi:hypothetical protein